MRTHRASPIPKFLEVSAEAGPFEMLSLSAAECTPARVEAALQRQLDRVGAHAEGDTPEADEVRLALHAAAAQLLDPEVRRLILEQRLGSAIPAAEPAGSAESIEASGAVFREPITTRPAAEVPHGAARRDEIAYQDGTSPDPNAPVKRALLVGTLVAIGVIGLVVGMIVLTSNSATSPASPNPVASGGGPDTPVGSATGKGTPTAGKGAASVIEQTAPLADQSQTASGPTNRSVVSTGRSEFVDGALIVRELRAAAFKAKSDPAGGLAEFRKQVARLADWWPRYEMGDRRAADDAVLEFLYVVSDKPEAADAVAELGRRAALPPVEAGQLSADLVWPAAWATGALMRLSVEQGVPRSLAAAVAQALNDALGAGRATGTLSFEGGAEASLRRMPLRLVAPRSPRQTEADPGAPRTSGEAVKRWADAIVLVGGEGSEVERLLVDGLEQILLNGPEPDSDRAAFEAVEVIATRIRWRAQGAARDRLLEWFNDPRVSSADLRVLTGVLANKSTAEGVDASMQLSITASPDDRALLRAQFAKVWGLAKTEQRDKALEQWRSVARGGYFQPAGDDELAKVARLVVAVRINHAARRLWLGDPASCTRLVSDVENIPQTIRDIGSSPAATPVPLPGPGPGSPPPPGRGPGRGGGGGGGGGGGKTSVPSAPVAPPGEGPWAEQYLRAERNIPVRLQRLGEAEALQSPLTKVDAAVLVEAACFATPWQVRAAAQRVVMKLADDPFIVQCALDELPIAPKVQGVSEMMARISKSALPKVGDPDWELVTRRALVDRLLGLLAGQGPQAGIDQACALIGESYAAMAGADSGPQEESAAERCVRGAGQLFKLWRMEAERLPPPEGAPSSLDQIDRRRRSRQQIASGPVQAFAGEEVSVAEILAYIVCAERPALAVRASAAMDEMAKDRREAGHIFDQMTATEHAIARLWALRFGEVAQ